MRLLTIIQARMNSSRLPGKVMRPVLYEPLLLHQIRRVQASRYVDALVIATTTDPADDPIVDLCISEEITCFRGHPTDLLDRHYQAAHWFKADAVVKIPSDCPLIDPDVISRVLRFYLDNDTTYDYVSNLHPASYPDGNDVEVMSFAALQTAWRDASHPWEREHTTPYLWDNPDRFRIGNVAWESGLDYSLTHRWTLDYEADYAFIKEVYEALYPQDRLFHLNDILALLERCPDLATINSHLAGVNWYRHHLGQLKTVGAEQTRLETERLRD